MPKPKWNLSTIYISERLQESLRPISRCAMTTVVTTMGYGKTTAVNWYLGEHAKTETLHINPYQRVFRQPCDFLEERSGGVLPAQGSPSCGSIPCPTDAAGGGLLVDDLCHMLAGESPCYIFIDDFHLLTDKRAPLFLCMLANRLPANVHVIVASRDRFLPAAEAVRLGARYIKSAWNSCASTIRSLRFMPTAAGQSFPMRRWKAFSIPARAGSLPYI